MSRDARITPAEPRLRTPPDSTEPAPCTPADRVRQPLLQLSQIDLRSQQRSGDHHAPPPGLGRSRSSPDAFRVGRADRADGVASSTTAGRGGTPGGDRDRRREGWPAPSYPVVRRIIAGPDRGVVTVTHHGPTAYRMGSSRCRGRESAHPNDPARRPGDVGERRRRHDPAPRGRRRFTAAQVDRLCGHWLRAGFVCQARRSVAGIRGIQWRSPCNVRSYMCRSRSCAGWRRHCQQPRLRQKLLETPSK